MIGVYTITNRIDGKMYVGFSNNIPHRWRVHKSHLNKNKHSCYYLQQAWNKYGSENFSFEILEECNSEYLCSQENYWTNLLNTRNPLYGYNYKETNPECKCKQHEQSRQKISQRRKAWILKNPGVNNFGFLTPEMIDKRKKTIIKKVIQYDLTGNQLQIYDSVTGTKQYGFIPACVSACCNKKIRIYKGYVFRFEGDPFSITQGKIKSKYEPK